MKKRTPVSKIMTANPITVDVSTDLRTVNKLMTGKHIRHVPVVSHDKLVGVISHTDIMRLSFGSLFEGQSNADEAIFDMLSLEQVMVSNPKTVTSTTEIREVAEFLTTAEFHALPVVDDGKLTGIVTTTDVIKYLIEQYA
ncbi:MAG: CBS domain-containing protein [Chitinophagaceae bacterium]|nr:CBS domain-containing protein [Chitinophagaceae bacterium]